jgi:hypothetical protein
MPIPKMILMFRLRFVQKAPNLLFVFSAFSAYFSALCVELAINRRERRDTQRVAEMTASQKPVVCAKLFRRRL